MPKELPPVAESSGYLVNYEGEKRAITGVIHIKEMEGDEVRARLLKSIRQAIIETRRARELAQKLADSFQR
jgi:hypothetical protein